MFHVVPEIHVLEDIYYTVHVTTDEPTTDIVGFVTEIFRRVEHIEVTKDRMLKLVYDNVVSYYNLDHVRIVHIIEHTKAKQPIVPSPVYEGYEPVLIPGVSESSVVEFPRPKK
jgi:hypothetical protein